MAKRPGDTTADDVVLVDRDDCPVGTVGKLTAHERGLLHRAFSIFVFNPQGALLLQQRNPLKYHCGGLWSNTCCSHPRPGEALEAAAHRRLMEEMGFDCALEYVRSFIYRVEFDNGLVEHELDHIFCGSYQGDIVVNRHEVSAYKWEHIPRLMQDISMNHDQYTPWLSQALGIASAWRTGRSQ